MISTTLGKYVKFLGIIFSFCPSFLLTLLNRSSIMVIMNRLDINKRAQILSCLVEGNSIRATSRMTDAAKNTVVKLLCDIGSACAEYQNKTLRDLSCKRVQCDEIWSFCYAKQKNVPQNKQGQFGYGDVWTWTAICTDTKLVPSFLVGDRTLETDFATLIKLYGADPEAEKRYSPAKCIGAERRTITGNPDSRHISTSFSERQNLTMRMSMRRFTRLTNAFSKKVENLAHAVSLHFMYYNFGRIHRTLRVTPAMEAGVSEHVWSLEKIAALTD